MVPLEDVIAEAVKNYIDSTARPHNCVGFDCKVCAVNGARYVELKEAIRSVL